MIDGEGGIVVGGIDAVGDLADGEKDIPRAAGLWGEGITGGEGEVEELAIDVAAEVAIEAGETGVGEAEAEAEFGEVPGTEQGDLLIEGRLFVASGGLAFCAVGWILVASAVLQIQGVTEGGFSEVESEGEGGIGLEAVDA